MNPKVQKILKGFIFPLLILPLLFFFPKASLFALAVA